MTTNNKKYVIKGGFDKNKSDNTNGQTEKIKSIEGYECIGPCYPPNTFFYNPSNLQLVMNPYPSCPIKEKKIINPDGSVLKKISAKCKEEDINKGHLYFDVFSDSTQIATTPYNFLTDIYNLTNITDVVRFLSNDFDVLPIYSKRRLLDAIYSAYYRYVEFPKLLFAKKLLFVLENIYKITNLDEDKIILKLNNLNLTETGDLYNFFY